jgi:type II secretory pathway pseudopilin PulG
MLTKRFPNDGKFSQKVHGFTLVEAVVSLGLLGIIVMAVLGAITSGMNSLRMARENLRATQILVEKSEALRLYNWDQLNTNFVPTEFITPYDILSNSTNSGVLYYGTISLAPAALGTTYTDAMRTVTIRINWKTGHLNRSRELTTYVCRSGLQNYVY